MSRGGAGARRKGGRIEREAVAILQEHGLAAERIPLSGSAGGSFAGDITCPVLGTDRRMEVKCRASGFRQIYSWKASNFGLVIRRDKDRPLIVLDLADFARLALDADKRRIADEYDAAQERGEISKQGAHVPNGNMTTDDLGLSRKDIYEARLIRDAEEAEPEGKP